MYLDILPSFSDNIVNYVRSADNADHFYMFLYYQDPSEVVISFCKKINLTVSIGILR